jgi:hypothetical protein
MDRARIYTGLKIPVESKVFESIRVDSSSFLIFSCLEVLYLFGWSNNKYYNYDS